jgi:hypothetical protein
MKKLKRILFGEDIFPNNSVWIIGVAAAISIFVLSTCGVF